MRSLTAGPNEAGQRLDKFLAKYMNLAGKSFLYKMIRKKNITLNGHRCDGSEKLALGDEIRLYLSDDTIEKFSEVKLQKVKERRLDILYEDGHILLINKPVGMLSQKAKDTDESLVEYVTDYLLRSGQITAEALQSFRPSVCNRLDRNTSGIVAAGKSLAGLQVMSEIFRDRSIHKYYLCIVKGVVAEQQAVEGYLTKNPATNRVTVTRKQEGEDSLPIATEYSPLASNGRYTLLRVALLTGRTHQIRAHLASIGHPIAGDHKYGDPQANEQMSRRYQVKSQLLHAYELVMPDELPEPLESLSGRLFKAGPPERFWQVMKGEGLWVPGIPEA